VRFLAALIVNLRLTTLGAMPRPFRPQPGNGNGVSRDSDAATGTRRFVVFKAVVLLVLAKS
jgi:hypothetical protein